MNLFVEICRSNNVENCKKTTTTTTHPSKCIQKLSKKGTTMDPFLQENVHFCFLTRDHAQSARFGTC